MSAQKLKEDWGHAVVIKFLSLAESNMLGWGQVCVSDLHRQGYLEASNDDSDVRWPLRLTERGRVYLAQMREEYLAAFPLIYGRLTGWIAIQDSGLPTARLIRFRSAKKGIELEEQYYHGTGQITSLTFLVEVTSDQGVEFVEPDGSWIQRIFMDPGHRMAKGLCPSCQKTMSSFAPIEEIPEWKGYRYICDDCQAYDAECRMYWQDLQAQLDSGYELGL